MYRLREIDREDMLVSNKWYQMRTFGHSRWRVKKHTVGKNKSFKEKKEELALFIVKVIWHCRIVSDYSIRASKINDFRGCVVYLM